MRRLLVFAVLLLAFAIWQFPHARVVERLLARRLEGLPVRVDVGSVAPSLWPLGYRLRDVVVHAPDVRAGVDELRFGLLPGSRVEAVACGGTVRAAVESAQRGDALRLRFEDVDPSKCATVGPVEVSGSFDGELVLEGLGAGQRASLLGPTARSGSLVVEGRSGRVSGHLPARPATPGNAGAPIGTWDFTRTALRARLAGSEVVVESASAEAEGVRWEVVRGSLAPGAAGRTRLSADVRAQRIDDSPRAKAVLGLLPRAGEDPDGWRRYRVTGTLDAPKIVGLR